MPLHASLPSHLSTQGAPAGHWYVSSWQAPSPSHVFTLGSGISLGDRDGELVGTFEGLAEGDTEGATLGVLGLAVGARTEHVPKTREVTQFSPAAVQLRVNRQSESSQQACPVVHGRQVPPQSMAVSVPPKIPSVQEASEGLVDGLELGTIVGTAEGPVGARVGCFVGGM